MMVTTTCLEMRTGRATACKWIFGQARGEHKPRNAHMQAQEGNNRKTEMG